MERMEETNMRTVVIASLFCILLCLSSGLASAQFPTEKLEISAPDVATVGEEVTIIVTAEGKPIEGADVSANGIGIGKTDSNGQLKYTFTETGPVVLVAEKPGYLPAAEFTLRIEPVPTPTVPPTPPIPSPAITIPVPTTPPVYHILPVIQPEKPVTVEIEKEAITKIAIKVKNEARNVNISVLKLPGKPPEIRVEPPGRVYGYFEIEASAETEASVSDGNAKVTIEFKVDKKWLVETNTDKTTVRLCRWHEGEWEILPTKVEGEDSVYVYFSAECSGFSTYAITTTTEEVTPTPAATPKPTATSVATPVVTATPVPATPTPAPTPTPSPTPKPPGFEAAFAIASLLAVAYLVLRRKP